MTDQPTALRLADEIAHPDGEPNWETCLAAAAELGRLHAALVDTQAEQSIYTLAIEEQRKRIIALEAAARQALPQLEYMASGMTHASWKTAEARRALDALREALEGKA